jgi:tetratricopeptide (TPR) repeat protein
MIRACAAALVALLLTTARGDAQTLADAQRLFYNAHYQEAADLALKKRQTGPYDHANYEVTTTSKLFVLRGLLKGQDAYNEGNKSAALKACARCPDVIAEFTKDQLHGSALAREKLKTAPTDETALFYLGKLDLNFVWLHLGLLGKKTGLDEYKEARRSLDALLKLNPTHVRGKVARAWIEYIVATRMPWGTRWILGGGNKKKGLTMIREATATRTDPFSHAEAEFALWDMLLREKDLAEATEVARRIGAAFPENSEVSAFLTTRGVR